MTRITDLVLNTHETFPVECKRLLKTIVCLECDGDIVRSL